MHFRYICALVWIHVHNLKKKSKILTKLPYVCFVEGCDEKKKKLWNKFSKQEMKKYTKDTIEREENGGWHVYEEGQVKVRTGR